MHLASEGVENAALKLDPEWVAQIRESLSEEPSVTNRRFGT